MNLRRVTITGADNSTNVDDLVTLTMRYPFVEWGILFGTGTLLKPRPRFPGWTWIDTLLGKVGRGRLSAHLCGRWVRDIVLDANPTFFAEYGPGACAFGRIQLNFHGQFHMAHRGLDFVLTDIRDSGVGVIMQFDSVNDSAASKFVLEGLATPLFDISGGAGILPSEWPKPLPGWNGYAGGLSPENVVEQIGRIAAVAGDSETWIDVETRVRVDDDSALDMAKVESFLAQAAPFVKG